MNLEEEIKKMKNILDNMSIEDFDNMLERCGINEIKNTDEIIKEEELI